MKTFITNGIETKNITLPQYPNEAWTFTSNAPPTGEYELYCSVAAAYRAINLTADATAGLPFAVMDKAGEDIDTSKDWRNVVGFMPNPKDLIRLWRMSLSFTNAAYGFMDRIGGKEYLRYIVPTTITPELSPVDGGLLGFKRDIGHGSKLWASVNDKRYDEELQRMFWIWKRDHSTELLPAKGTEFKAMMTAAGIMYSSDKYVQRFFDSGGIKPHLLKVSGVPDPTTRDNIEKWWTKVITYGYKYLGKVVNAEQLEAVAIGEGIEGFESDAIYKNKLADIAMAIGIPLSLLLSNSATYATAMTEYVQWYRNTLIPWADFMAETMNVLLFEPLGYSFEFRSDATDPKQTEEADRSIAYKRYIDAGMDPALAAQMIGLEMPKGYTYDDLDVQRDDNVEFIADAESTADKAVDDVGIGDTEIKAPPYVPTLEQLREMELWQSFAFRKHKRGQSLNFEFDNRTMPDDVHKAIQERLVTAESEADIKAAFDLDTLLTNEDAEVIRLANSINKLADSISGSKADE
jgi:hypothetical protein